MFMVVLAGTSESDTSSVEDLSSSSSDLPPAPLILPRAPIRPLSLPLAPDLHTHPLHTLAASGEREKLREYVAEHSQADVNQPMNDGSTPVYAAAEHGQHGTSLFNRLTHRLGSDSKVASLCKVPA